MSQQTGIERVGPAWRRFIERWPTPGDLAEAGTHELLAAWAGLGYNRRALALRDAARAIVADHGGRVPGTVEALERLPGVGPYTARAVAATAFDVPVAPLDVNTRRVVSRVLGVPTTWPGLQAAADDLVSREPPGRWLDAVMDLATATCTRRAPRCDLCPLAALCVSRGSVVPVEADEPRRAVPGDDSLASRTHPRCPHASADGVWVPLPERLGQHDAERDRRRGTRSRARGVPGPPRRGGSRPGVSPAGCRTRLTRRLGLARNRASAASCRCTNDPEG